MQGSESIAQLVSKLRSRRMRIRDTTAARFRQATHPASGGLYREPHPSRLFRGGQAFKPALGPQANGTASLL